MASRYGRKRRRAHRARIAELEAKYEPHQEQPPRSFYLDPRRFSSRLIQRSDDESYDRPNGREIRISGEFENGLIDEIQKYCMQDQYLVFFEHRLFYLHEIKSDYDPGFSPGFLGELILKEVVR